MSTPFQTETLPFANRGLRLDRSSSELQPGEFEELTNLISIQEGSLQTRNGNQRLTPASGLIHTISKLRVSDDEAQNKYYLGIADAIYRADGPLPASGAGMAFASIAAATADPAADYTKQRFGAVQYNAGTVGSPSEYLAAPLKMLKDDQGEVTMWGIYPPTRPVVAELDALVYIDDTFFPDHHADFITRPHGAAPTTNDRLPGPLTVVSIQGTAPGQLTITPTSMDLIIQGMMVQIGSIINVRVEAILPTSFVVYSETMPVVGNTIIAYQCKRTSGTATAGAPWLVAAVPLALDCSFDGDPSDGYETDDIVHIGIYIDDATKVQEIRVRMHASPIPGVALTDYYEKAISINSLTKYASTLAPAIQTLQTQVPNVSTGIVGGFNIPNQQSQQAKPAELSLLADATQIIPVWTEIDIPKTQFVAIGNAGKGQYTWKNISNYDVLFTVQHDNDVATVGISSLYVAGGYGPNGRSTNNTLPRQPYKYLYTYRDPDNNHQGNPCAETIESNAITPQRQRVKLTLQGTGDVPHIPTTGNAPSIAIYRSGGLFADALYRLIGYATNPGANATVTFLDTQDDTAIEQADVIELDNDPPVISDLKIPFRFGNTGYTSGTGAAGALSTFGVAVLAGPSQADILRLLKPGNTVTISLGTPSEEDVVVEAIALVGGVIRITAFFQNDHTYQASFATSTFLSVDAVSGHGANLACSAFDSLFVAGDVDNPHKLYQSKTGQPEAFPIEDLSTGTPKIINVGSPSNPIMGITELNGVIVSLNLSAIYIITVFGGSMQTPARSPAQRGCVGQSTWCKAINEVWYLGVDGIYSWAGGESSKRSQELEPLFRGISVGNYLPFDMSKLDRSTFSYYRNQIKITYINTQGFAQRLVYDLIYKRWLWEDIGDSIAGAVQIPAQYVEEDTGRLLLSKFIAGNGYLYLDDVGTSDGWVNAGNDGAPINFAMLQGAFTAGAPQTNKQFSDRLIEMQNDQDNVAVETFYDFSDTADPADSQTLPPPAVPAGRRRVAQTFHFPFGFEAYAIQFRYSGNTKSVVKFFTNTFNFFSLEQTQIGRAFDWDDLGSPDDKRLYEITIWYDAKPTPRTWTLDVIQGIGNQQVVTEEVQDFILEPLQGVYHKPAWTQVTFPINDGLLDDAGVPNSIVKKIRLRPKGFGVVCLPTDTQKGLLGQYGVQMWGPFPGNGIFKVAYDGMQSGQVTIQMAPAAGSAWVDATGTKLIFAGAGAANGVAVGFQGSVIYILYAGQGTANPRSLTISRYDTSAQAWLSDIAVTPTLDTTATASGFGPGQMAIAVKPNGKIEILINGAPEAVGGPLYARVVWSEFDGTSWSVPTSPPNQAGIAKDFLVSQILVSQTNRTHLIYQTFYTSTTGYEVLHVAIPDGGAMAAGQTLATDASTRVMNLPVPTQLGTAYRDVHGVDKLAIPYIGGGAATDGSPDFGPAKINKILRADDADVPAWTTETFDTGTQVSGFQPSMEVLISTAYDPSTDALYVFWVSPDSYGTPGGAVVTTSGKVLYSANSGSGWTTPIVSEQFAAPVVPSGAIGSFLVPGTLSVLIYLVDTNVFYGI